MNNVSIFTIIDSIFNCIKQFKKERVANNGNVIWINDLASFGRKWWERKITEIVTILLRGTEDKPIYIGELAYAIKGKEFMHFMNREESRVNQCLDLIMKSLWELNLLCIKENAILLGDKEDFTKESEEQKNTTYGLWWNHKYSVYDIEIPEWEKGLRTGTPDSVTSESMFGNKYVKQYGRGKDHCSETRKILNDVEFTLNKHLLEYCNIEHKPDDAGKRQAYLMYEYKILQKISLEEPTVFHNEYNPDSRGRLYVNNDVGNYIGLRSIRGLVKFNHVEFASPDAIED